MSGYTRPEVIWASDLSGDVAAVDLLWAEGQSAWARMSSAFRPVAHVLSEPGRVVVQFDDGTATQYAPSEKVRVVRRRCDCNGADLPLFDHHRLCILREGASA